MANLGLRGAQKDEVSGGLMIYVVELAWRVLGGKDTRDKSEGD